MYRGCVLVLGVQGLSLTCGCLLHVIPFPVISQAVLAKKMLKENILDVDKPFFVYPINSAPAISCF